MGELSSSEKARIGILSSVGVRMDVWLICGRNQTSVGPEEECIASIDVSTFVFR